MSKIFPVVEIGDKIIIDFKNGMTSLQEIIVDQNNMYALKEIKK